MRTASRSWSMVAAVLVILAVVLALMTRHAGSNRTVAASGAEPNMESVKLTVVYDNYTLCEECRTDWGFACIIEGMAKTILFDTGTSGDLLLENMDKLQVEAGHVDLVVISHNHGDHTGGLTAFLDRRGGVPAYLPKSVSSELVRNAKARGASVVIADKPLMICEHVYLTGPLGDAVIEQSLILDTPQGLVVVTGCAHPGIVQIVCKAKEMLAKEVYFVMGGFHLGQTPETRIQDIIDEFRGLGVQKVGPCHCTGDRAIELFKQAYAEDFVPMGVGKIEIAIGRAVAGD
jgi:7,8-dihydropterin-6-yl-methyl-4-(beta-D-ribofuranosyl)aminobenzene 5'-phosphate synthase